MCHLLLLLPIHRQRELLLAAELDFLSRRRQLRRRSLLLLEQPP
eukprot:SAG22_NODE_5371_length_1026_cov_2.008630_1_plen_43_part_10